MPEYLPTVFFALAPMDDVTDTVFRQVVGNCAPPDLYFTEFVNADGLQSPGRPRLLKKLRFTKSETPLIAQIWGKDPDNFYKTAQELADGSLAEELAWYARHPGSNEVLGSKEQRRNRTNSTASERRTQLTPQFTESAGGVGGSADKQNGAAWMPGVNFSGIDLNMGCPVKAEVANGTCSALMNNRELASEIIKATQGGAAGKLPVSVKTRLGFNELDLSWAEFLLGFKLNMLSIHGRTRKQMSKVPADWEAIGKIRELRDGLALDTLIVGNGDVMSRKQGLELAQKYKLDGIMIGRGIFQDPFVFCKDQPCKWENYDMASKIALYKKHVELFAATWQAGERPIKTLNKFCKIYVNGFDGAKELREQLMQATSSDVLLRQLDSAV